MNTDVAELEQELRPSVNTIAMAFVVAAISLLVLTELHLFPSRNVFLIIGSALFFLAALVWLLGKWKDEAGRWAAVLGVMGVIALGTMLAGVEVFAFFYALPIVLTAALLGAHRLIFAMLAESVVLLALSWAGAFGGLVGAFPLALLSIWLVGGVLFAMSAPHRKRLEWFWSHYLQAREMLDEAQHDREHLSQVMADLAQSNRQLNLLNERLEVMYAVAEEAQIAKTTFVAKVSHELRTPLNMIIGLADVLSEAPEMYGEPVPDALLKDLEIVRRNAEHLSNMINDVLDLSQADSGQLTLHREWVDMKTEVGKAVTVIRPLVEKKQLVLQMDMPPDLPQVYCDRTRIRQVVLNLVGNAVRYTDSGEISIAIRQENQEMVVSITDTGPGLRPEEADRIFDPFYRAVGTGAHESGASPIGSGLGLNISKQFIEAHHGRIWVESELGAGSTFAFRIPIAPFSAPTATANVQRWCADDWFWSERASWPQLPKSPYQYRVIVIDKTGTLQPHLEQIRNDVEFVAVNSPSEVTAAIHKYPAHLLLVNVPATDQLHAQIDDMRRSAPLTPIIGCTFPPRPHLMDETGVFRYLIKPITRSHLEEALQALPGPVQRVLIVDDVEEVQYVLKRMLQLLIPDIVVDGAATGSEALQALRRDHPDIVLLDIVLPDIDGWEVLKQKGRDPAIADIPTIMISAEDPVRQPMRSNVLVASIGAGLSLTQLMNCSLSLSRELLHPAGAPSTPAPR
jgi:signal transduction histidine kinase/CheY-like chemotaxis protein